MSNQDALSDGSEVAAEFALDEAVGLIKSFGAGSRLTSRIRLLEASARGQSGGEIVPWLEREQLGAELWTGARGIKAIAAQINTLVHAVGILISLPYLLEDGEIVESLSLGAGNTGRAHDLETSRQVAEFKFIDWRGGSESIRQNSVFHDVYGLVSAETDKRKVLYLLGTEHAERFLHGGRAVRSVLSRNAKARRAFYEVHAEDEFPTVASYWKTIEHLVEIKNLRELVPVFAEG